MIEGVFVENQFDNRCVSLSFYNDSFSCQIRNYQFGNTKFSTAPFQAMKSIANNKDAQPVMILDNKIVIGFLILEKLPHQSIYGIYNQALLFRTFSLDANYRGRGLSKIAMDALIPFIKTNFSDRTTIVLTVNHANTAAIELYKRIGYRDTGRTFIGKKGKQYIFERYI